ncbi:MAG: fumarate reductase subunit FrdD [Alphaproteobacteria bacterium]
MAISNKPIVWSLFAGGGLVAAFLVPAMIVVTGLAVPMGLAAESTLAYDRMAAFVGNPLIKLVLFGIIFLLLWHAAHRIKMTLHDLGVGSGRTALVICYGAAAVGTIAAATALVGV